MDCIHQARLAQSVEHQTLNRRVVGSNPTVDKKFFILYFVASDALLAGRLAPCKWNQAWRPSELYMCIEREKVDFKSREVNCLKECALALNQPTYFNTYIISTILVTFKYLFQIYHYSNFIWWREGTKETLLFIILHHWIELQHRKDTNKSDIPLVMV